MKRDRVSEKQSEERQSEQRYRYGDAEAVAENKSLMACLCWFWQKECEGVWEKGESVNVS